MKKSFHHSIGFSVVNHYCCALSLTRKTYVLLGWETKYRNVYCVCVFQRWTASPFYQTNAHRFDLHLLPNLYHHFLPIFFFYSTRHAPLVIPFDFWFETNETAWLRPNHSICCHATQWSESYVESSWGDEGFSISPIIQAKHPAPFSSMSFASLKHPHRLS